MPREYFQVPLDPLVDRTVRAAIDQLADLGAEVTEVSWPLYLNTTDIGNTIHRCEAASLHWELTRARGPEIHPTVRGMLEAGTFVSAPDYLLAQRARTAFTRQCLDLLREVDLLAGPMEPVTAHPIGETEVRVGDTVMGSSPALTLYTRPFNLTGFPAITVPCGFRRRGHAHRPAASRAPLRRGDGAPGGPRLRAGHRVAPQAPAHLESGAYSLGSTSLERRSICSIWLKMGLTMSMSTPSSTTWDSASIHSSSEPMTVTSRAVSEVP